MITGLITRLWKYNNLHKEDYKFIIILNKAYKTAGEVTKLDWNSIQSLIDRISNLWQTSIEVVNFDGIIVVSSDLDRRGGLNKELSNLKTSEHVETIGTTNYMTILHKQDLIAWLIWEGDKRLGESVLLKVAIEEALSMDKYRLANYSISKEEEILIKGLLDSQAGLNEKKLGITALEMGYDLSLPRAIIVVNLEPKENSYFNINLQLGYDVVREQMKDDIKKQIKYSMHITTQDIVSYYKDNLLIIGKAFLNTEDLHLIYQALDVIGLSIFELIKDNRIFHSQISYGSIATEISGLKKSYLEAINLIRINELCEKPAGFINGDEILFESMIDAFPDRFIGRYLEGLHQKLINSDNSIIQILDTAEAYIENNMNIKLTAEKMYMHRNTVAKHIERLEEIAGLRLDQGFTNIFITKMFLVYFRRKTMDKKGK